VAALAALAREGRLAALAGMDHSLRSTDVVSALCLTVAFARTFALAFGRAARAILPGERREPAIPECERGRSHAVALPAEGGRY
jgi:hypothetical protein